jgi:hypothetical protein
VSGVSGVLGKLTSKDQAMAEIESRDNPGATPAPAENTAGRTDEDQALGTPEATRNASALAIDHCAPTSDFPAPPARTSTDIFVWDDDDPPAQTYAAMGHRLALARDIYRAPQYAAGLILALNNFRVPPLMIQDAKQLAPIILDRVPVNCRKGGKDKGRMVPARHLSVMLRAESFLQQFRPVDEVTTTAQYLDDFTLTKPGYNDGGPGRRIIYAGHEPVIGVGLDAITRFLDVMAFQTNADRTNAVAGALTVLLRNKWPGAKPFLCVTGTKSHSGKDTIIQFAANGTAFIGISYQTTDWALERSIVGAVKHSPQAGLIVLENARLDRRARFIASAFVERLLTDPEPFLFSTGTGAPLRRRNNQVLAVSSNFGSVSEDLMNRGIPIHLSPLGNVADRRSPIGNPKLEYLPTHVAQIEAELRGMIAKWDQEGRPLDLSVRHPFTDWARTIGGMLRANGFTDFLGNYSARKTADDPIRRAIGLLGTESPRTWLAATDWAKKVVDLGLVRVLIPEADRENEKSVARAVGILFSAHLDETFAVETEDARLSLQLQRARRRFENGVSSTRYQFEVLSQTALPPDEETPREPLLA